MKSVKHTIVARVRSGAGLFLAAGLVAGCSLDQMLGSGKLPPDVPDPAARESPAGALETYRGALVEFRRTFGGNAAWAFIPMTGLFADELQPGGWGSDAGVGTLQVALMNIDGRQLPELGTVGAGMAVYDVTYQHLNKVRGQAREGIGALAKYAPDVSPALRGHLYALQGYAEIFLADLFCSGIPLSTLDFEGDYSYRPGSTTEEVYEHAVALFDSALVLSADSTSIQNLARVGRARALLDLGRYAQAAAAVSDVPGGYSYDVAYSVTRGADPDSVSFLDNDSRNFAVLLPYGASLNQEGGLTVTEREGSNGLPYISERDPRVPVDSETVNRAGIPQYRSTKYAVEGDSPVTLGGGVEARLIEAEALLHAGDANWLATLNALRTDGTFIAEPSATDSTKTDTLWSAGTAGISGLAPLTDPGTDAARVDLLFRERAYWLFLTGHRQGDMRRLVRQYGRDPQAVYATGLYPGNRGVYGTEVTVPIPPAERLYNPKFAGCFDRGA